MMRIIIIILVFSSCRGVDNTDSKYFINQIEQGTDSTFQRKYDSDNNLLFSSTRYYNSIYNTEISYFKKRVFSIKGYLIDSLYGHFFEFYDNGKLKLYCYYIENNKNSSFIRNYSTDSKLEKEQGNPFVDHMDSDNDSIDLFFSNVFYDAIDVEFSFGKLKNRKMILRTSMMQPLLLESRLPISNNVLYMKIKTVERKGKQRKVYYDTLELR